MGNIAIDAYDKLYVRNENIAAPTTFLDSALTPKTITANGNAKQLPIKFNKSAGFFNGTSDYVYVPNHTDFDFGTGDFNIEVFANWNTVQSGSILGMNSLAIELYYSAGHFIVYQVGVSRIDYTWTPTANTWYHIRARRVSGTTTLYVDGVSQGTYAGSDNITSGGNPFSVGKQTNASVYFNGWMKEVRVIKGTSTTITVPTTAYTSASEANTVLLMHFDTPASSPIAPAIYFDGTGDYLSLADHADWDFGTGDFTLEGFCRCPDWTTGREVIIDVGDSWNNVGVCLFYYSTSGGIVSYLQGTTYTFPWTPVANNGYHIALSRSGTSLKCFVNGVQIGSTETSSGNIAVATTTRIGAMNGVASYLAGYLREVRVSNTARYTSAFTPSQTGFTVDSNTKLYIKGNEANGVTTFVDSETTPKTVTTNGNTVIKYTEDYRSCIFKDDGNTGHKPYPVGLAKIDFFAMSNGVVYFDGTGDWLSAPDSADWEFGSSPFSIDCYVRTATDLSDLGFVAHDQDGSNGWDFYLLSTTALKFEQWTAASRDINASASWTPIANTWYHLMVTKDGSNDIRLFVNGVLLSTTNDSSAVSNFTGSLFVGRNGTVIGTNAHTGLMDNIRIAKGVARYTATFDPPFDDAAAAGRTQIIWMD